MKFYIFFILLNLLVVYVINEKKYHITQAYFQHNKHVNITNKSIECLQNYKRELLKRITKVFTDNDIKYFIGNGNLLEIERSKNILQDDDIDIRYSNIDIDKFTTYVNNLEKIDEDTELDEHTYLDKDNHLIIKTNNKTFNKTVKYKNLGNLKWCQVMLDINDYKGDGFEDYDNLRNDFNEIFLNNNIGDKINFEIHCDIVNAKYSLRPNLWYDFQYVFEEPLRNVEYLNTNVTIPSRNMTTIILKREYGNNYMIPDKTIKNHNGKYYQYEKITDIILKSFNNIKYDLNL